MDSGVCSIIIILILIEKSEIRCLFIRRFKLFLHEFLNLFFNQPSPHFFNIPFVSTDLISIEINSIEWKNYIFSCSHNKIIRDFYLNFNFVPTQPC